MLNNFGEVESGLPVLLVHVQKRMMSKCLVTGTVQDMMRELQIKMAENAKAKKRDDLASDEHLKKTPEEDQINALLKELTEMINEMTKKTEEIKENKEEDTETNVTKITSKPFNFIDEVFETIEPSKF